MLVVTVCDHGAQLLPDASALVGTPPTAATALVKLDEPEAVWSVITEFANPAAPPVAGNAVTAPAPAVVAFHAAIVTGAAVAIGEISVVRLMTIISVSNSDNAFLEILLVFPII